MRIERLAVIWGTLIFALMLFCPTKHNSIHAQNYQVPCPTGYSVLNGSQTRGSTGLIAYMCVNSDGAVVFVGQCANPTSNPTPADCGGGSGISCSGLSAMEILFTNDGVTCTGNVNLIWTGNNLSVTNSTQDDTPTILSQCLGSNTTPTDCGGIASIGVWGGTSAIGQVYGVQGYAGATRPASGTVTLAQGVDAQIQMAGNSEPNPNNSIITKAIALHVGEAIEGGTINALFGEEIDDMGNHTGGTISASTAYHIKSQTGKYFVMDAPTGGSGGSYDFEPTDTSLNIQQKTLPANGNLAVFSNSNCSGNVPGVDYVCTTTLSSAQILALNGTPVSAISAPGSGLTIVPYQMTATYNFVTTAYAGAGCGIVLTYDDTTGGIVLSVQTIGLVDQTASAFSTAIVTGNPVALSMATNTSLKFSTVDTYTTGDGTVTFSIYYHVK